MSMARPPRPRVIEIRVLASFIRERGNQQKVAANDGCEQFSILLNLKNVSLSPQAT